MPVSKPGNDAYCQTMMRIFQIFVLVFLCTSVAARSSHAEKAPTKAELAAESAPAQGLVFLELFSAERCPFCPQAERNMKDILADLEVLGFTCMVDYFDSDNKGDPAHSFCTVQQDLYINKLKSGARYTPQMVINGRVQFPGYDFQKTAKEIRKERTSAQSILPLLINAGSVAGSYDVVLPQIAKKPEEKAHIPVTPPSGPYQGDYVLRLIVLQKAPPLLTANNGPVSSRVRSSPTNKALSIRDEGFWDGNKTIWSAVLAQEHSGDAFLVVVQNRKTGAIVAAGESALPSAPDHPTD